jgi:hypothetical protein
MPFARGVIARRDRRQTGAPTSLGKRWQRLERCGG